MPAAYCLIREELHYRRECFVEGIARAGYDLRKPMPTGVRPGDLLVVWNRYGAHEQIADRFEADGGTVVVAENGYLKGRLEGGKYFALARHAHNGRGQWSVGGPDRWNALGIELKAWRTTGQHILVCPNRCFGMRGGVMSASWQHDVVRRIQAVTNRPIRVRQHPHNHPPRVPLEDDLENAWAVAIWSSSVGVQALIAGIPVICDAPWWICKPAAGCFGSSDRLGDKRLDQLFPSVFADEMRKQSLQRLAWAQWTLEEISTGEPFRRLADGDGQACAHSGVGQSDAVAAG